VEEKGGVKRGRKARRRGGSGKWSVRIHERKKKRKDSKKRG